MWALRSGGAEDRAEKYQQGTTRYEAKKTLYGLLGEGGVAILKNEDSGEAVRMNRNSIGKLVSGSAVKKSVDNGFTMGQHYTVAANIVDLFKSSLKVLSHSDRAGNQDIKIHRYAAPLHVGDDVAYVTVKESRQHGKRMYSVERIEIGKLVGMLENALEQGSPALFPSTRVLHKDNIAKLMAAVKKKDKNLSDPPEGGISDVSDAPGIPKNIIHPDHPHGP